MDKIFAIISCTYYMLEYLTKLFGTSIIHFVYNGIVSYSINNIEARVYKYCPFHLPNIRMMALRDCTCFVSLCIEPCCTPVNKIKYEKIKIPHQILRWNITLINYVNNALCTMYYTYPIRMHVSTENEFVIPCEHREQS